MKGYSDLADLPEDERIRIIGEAAEAGNVVGVALENDEAKIRRYIEKVTKRFPTVRHVATDPGIVPGTVLVRFGPLARKRLTDEEISRRLPAIAKQVREVIKRELGDDHMLALLIQPWAENEQSPEVRGLQYVSNAPRDFIRYAMRTLLTNWDAEQGPPPHKRQ